MDSGINAALWIGLVATIVVGLITYVANWWVGTRRTVIAIASEVVPVAPELKAAGLEVIAEGKSIRLPHLVRVTFTNEGPSDIGPDDFKGGYLRCALAGGEGITLLGESESSPVSLTSTGLEVAPTLLPARGRLITQALFDGPVTATPSVMLRNARPSSPHRERRLRTAMIASAAMVIAGVLALLVVWIQVNKSDAQSASTDPHTVRIIWTNSGIFPRTRPELNDDNKVGPAWPDGTVVTIECAARGAAVSNGFERSTDLWYRVSDGTITGFIPDAFLNTGTFEPIAVLC